MENDTSILKINIYGTEYPIKSDAETDTEYIRRVADYVDKKMREIDQTTQSKSSLKVAILAALNITDELFQERGMKNSLVAEMEGKIKSLQGLLDSTLNQQEETF
ncbi:MAG TPA: cell division protein ZapA [bacterium]